MTVGIYAIKHKISGRMYIGSSVNIENRWGQHLHQLRKNCHKNGKLQNSWNKYKEHEFEFLIFEICVSENLLKLEQLHIDKNKSAELGFNISKIAGRERFGSKHTIESINKMSKSHKGKIISLEHREKLSLALKGRVFSAETKAKISASKTGKKRKAFTDEARKNMSDGQKSRHFKTPTGLTCT